ncbi:MAG: M48 family metalloprotease [Burkholderiaceae bacterium]
MPRFELSRYLRHGRSVLAATLVGCVLLNVIGTGGIALSTAIAQESNLPRIGDAAGGDLSPATERRIGEIIMRGLHRDNAMIDDAELTGYLSNFALRLTDTTPARGFQFEFFLLRDPTLNAFALPGGYIGVHSGLLQTASTESELASVLAHEIGHVTQRHMARMLARSERTSLLSLAAVFMAVLAASSNPDAAAGLIALGSSVYDQQMLSFSRDAEQEADRIGLEILREADFNTNDMIAFFARMQQATRLYENNAPSYLRTHPLTSERMADIQNRVVDLRYRQRVSSIGFHLVKAKLQVQSDTTKDGLQATRKTFETRLAQRTFISETATWYGLAVAASHQADLKTARESLANARLAAVREGYEKSHPFYERLAAQIELDAGQVSRASAIVDNALGQYPDALALRLLKVDIALQAGRFEVAESQIEDQLRIRRSEPNLWHRLGKAYAGQGKTGLSHWAVGEQYSLLGAWSAAREQFQLALRDKSVDFYRLSQIDTRIKETEQKIIEENEARQRLE